MEKGKFIVLEGQGFSGKTEQSPLLAKKLQKLGIKVIETQEPGGVESAIKIRKELLSRRAEGEITPMEELEYFYKARGMFLKELVIPSLSKGVWIVSTRFSPSTYVYQGKEGGVDFASIDKLEEKVVGKNEPDLCVLLDVEPEEIYKRMTQDHARTRHGYNELDKDILINRQKYYLQLALENRYKNWIIINGNGAVDEVHKLIWDKVKVKFNLN